MRNPYFSLIKTVWHYGSRWRPAIIGYYLAYILAALSVGCSPYAFGRAIDVLQNFKPDRLYEVIFWLGMGVGVLLLFWVFHGPARVIERTVALKVQHAFRLNLYKQLTQLPLTWHQDHHSGNIITRLNRASVALRQFAEYQFIYIETIVAFIVSIAFLLWISVPVGILSFVISSIVASTIFIFDRKLIPLWNSQNEIDNHVGAVLFDYISNMTTVLALRLGELTHTNLSQRMRKVWPFFRKDAVLNEAKWFTMNILLALVQAVILIVYILHSLQETGTILIGFVVMLFRYQMDLSTVFRELSIHYSDLVRMDTDIKGLNPILEDIKKLAHKPPGARTAQQWHTLEISELTFQHANQSNRQLSFNQIAFNIKRGEKIALIGSSGGGKSTLLSLLSGFYKPSQVKLVIDNVPFESLEPLKAITTLIPQEPEIFENSVAFNITLDLPTTPEEINWAVNLACFSPVLKTMPLGLETDIREKGLNMSVGQKQRLALARGLFAARYSSLILMDEPTSSIDLPTEKEILSAVIKAFPDAAMIVSLHRLHLLPKFDTIIMVHDGEIIAQGLTEILLSSPGPVYNLYKSYSNEYI
jgi:ATP-binding cassette, subfamily B, bacterial